MIAGTARGFRDILPKEALARERICATVRDCFADHGYLPVETPLLEDRSSLERGGRIKNTPFQLFDADGNLLMLRPDLTLPVARLVAGHIRDEELPARFRYNAPVVREQQSLRGQPRQFTQLGVELVGTDGAASEVEVVSLLAEVMETLEVPAWRLVFGSVTPLTGLLSNCSPSGEFSAQVLALVHDSDLVSLDELVDATPELKPSAARALHAVPRMHGGVEVIDAIDALLAEADVPPAERGTAELKALVGALAGLFAEGRASFDFSIINSFDYYTGIIFKGYAEGIAASLASGGRYDAVLANLGRPGLAACGFALSLERLQEVLGEQGESGVVTPGVRVASRPLRIAVPKGSLFKDSLRVLAAAGLPTEELADPGRKLIVRADDVEYIIVRAQDAPAFVGAGGADCGICGKDSLVEADLDLLQLVDLRYGGCPPPTRSRPTATTSGAAPSAWPPSTRASPSSTTTASAARWTSSRSTATSSSARSWAWPTASWTSRPPAPPCARTTSWSSTTSWSARRASLRGPRRTAATRESATWRHVSPRSPTRRHRR